MLRFAVALAALCMFIAPATANAGTCLPHLRAILLAGGFSGSLDCHHDQLSAKRIGTLTTGQHRFTIYDYRYKLAPACPECAVHGGQRVIFMRDGRYLGQIKPDGVWLSIRKNRLILTPDPTFDPDDQPTVLRFSPNGPPSPIRAAGEWHEIFR